MVSTNRDFKLHKERVTKNHNLTFLSKSNWEHEVPKMLATHHDRTKPHRTFDMAMSCTCSRRWLRQGRNFYWLKRKMKKK